MTKDEIVKYWIDKAESELKSAKVMFGAGYYLYTGYMCHQTIEKVLKALYIKNKSQRHPQLTI
jgi:HEPN domain-containing protein